jgi:hypothetical protein
MILQALIENLAVTFVGLLNQILESNQDSQ